ncbi:hypothetical protein [Salinibius halmophilus]|uniref:hypothetical protein n=1 Tax=Salinibius halmophilus TaxID=1853216 RepID=UPI000E6737C8|nr:hypothetical protein [Salinibius halmophilus]
MDAKTRTELVYLYLAAIFFPLFASVAVLLTYQSGEQRNPIMLRHATVLIWFAGILVVPYAIAEILLTGRLALIIQLVVLAVHVGLLAKGAWAIKNSQPVPKAFAWYTK